MSRTVAYLREASALSVLLIRAMRRPLTVRAGNRYRPCAFSFSTILPMSEVRRHHFLIMRKSILDSRPLHITLTAILTIARLSSCESAKTIALACQERQIEIYVDDEYLGRDLVYYSVPKGRKHIEVSCRDNGIEVYHRRINVRDRKGTLIELQIPKNYRYSSKPF